MKAETTRRPLLPCVGERIAHEVDAGRVANWWSAPSIRGLDAFVASKTTSLTPRRPRRRSLRKNSVQNVSAPEGPMSRPRISRRPSLLTPTAMMVATETMRPFWCTFR